MKTPKKICVSTDPFGFLHAYDCENHPPIVEEYVHKDTFIEKACDVYCKVCEHYAEVPTHICRQDCRYFEDFKKYMKGE